ncbi:MAG: XTP/dITP diphosphatase [Deltaproteobacteria bacterium]
MKITLATKNRGKAAEIREILRGVDVELLTLEDFPQIVMPPERGGTFRENAVEKARFVAEATGTAALADDSGLEVDFLGGRPGVFSARYAGAGATDKDNFTKLLKELEGVPFDKRKARFVCVIALAGPGIKEAAFEGAFEGYVSTRPSGRGGFGYDPVFFIPERNMTAAELEPGEKNRISHRARALEKMRAWLRDEEKIKYG